MSALLPLGDEVSMTLREFNRAMALLRAKVEDGGGLCAPWTRQTLPDIQAFIRLALCGLVENNGRWDKVVLDCDDSTNRAALARATLKYDIDSTIVIGNVQPWEDDLDIARLPVFRQDFGGNSISESNSLYVEWIFSFKSH